MTRARLLELLLGDDPNATMRRFPDFVLWTFLNSRDAVRSLAIEDGLSGTEIIYRLKNEAAFARLREEVLAWDAAVRLRNDSLSAGNGGDFTINGGSGGLSVRKTPTG